MEILNTNGNCPYCNVSWCGNDILAHIKSLDVFSFKPDKDILEVAKAYGYNKDKPKKFTNVIVHKIDKKITFYECPSCYHCFTINNKHYLNLDMGLLGKEFQIKLSLNIDSILN